MMKQPQECSHCHAPMAVPLPKDEPQYVMCNACGITTRVIGLLLPGEKRALDLIEGRALPRRPAQ